MLCFAVACCAAPAVYYVRCVCCAGARDSNSQLSQSALAAALRSLARAPCLPPLDWSTPLLQLMATLSFEADAHTDLQEAAQAALASSTACKGEITGVV